MKVWKFLKQNIAYLQDQKVIKYTFKKISLIFSSTYYVAAIAHQLNFFPYKMKVYEIIFYFKLTAYTKGYKNCCIRLGFFFL